MMKSLNIKGKRGTIYTVITILAIVILLCVNLLITYFGLNQMMIIDTTYEGLYTLTDLMKEECGFIDELEGGEVKITFCSDPDSLVESEATRVVYFMALQMAKAFDNLTVETVNVAYNPTAVSKYRPTSLSEIKPNDVIISYGDRYRVVSADAFWIASSGKVVAFYGEYKMATLIMSVTAVNRPSAYFVNNHGESYYDAENPDRAENSETSALYDMLTDRGLTVKTLDLSIVDSIPEDCVLLIINNPRSDFSTDPDSYNSLGYVSESEKLDRYLISNHGSIMVAKDHALSLPVFEEFLYEWGFDTSSAVISDEERHIENERGDFTDIIGCYDTDENSYGYTIYGEFASLSSAPGMLFSDAGLIECSWGEAEGTNEPGTYSVSRNFAPFFFTSDSATAYEADGDGNYVRPLTRGRLNIAAVTTRMELNSITGEYKYSYVFCVNSPEFFSTDMLGNTSFANFEVMSALTENMVRSDEYASMELGSTSANSSNRGGKILLDPTIYSDDTVEDGKLIFHGLGGGAVVIYSIILFAIPLGVAVAGICVRLRRKFL